VTTTHLQGRSYNYVTTAMVGVAQLAAINAVALLFRPVQTMLIAWRRTALPQLAAHYVAGEREAFERQLLTALLMAAAGFAAWCALLWLGWGLIARVFLAGKYPDAVLLMLPWAIVAAIETAGFILSAALQAAREFRFLAYVTLASAPVTIAATVGFTAWHGYTWTIYGVAVGGLVATALASWRLLLVHRRLAPSPLPHDGRSAGVRLR